MLPPRRAWMWFKPDAAERRKPGDAPSKLIRAMANHVLKELRKPSPQYRWVHRLRCFLSRVRARALAWTSDQPFKFDMIHAFPKGNPGNRQKYRIVAEYSLENSLICGGFSAYLRDLVDGELESSALAFRASVTPDTPPPTHHDAVEKILGVLSNAGPTEALWCAEADIEGFFDAVSHDVARRETHRLLSWVKRPTDPRLYAFLDSFLSGYDYVHSARDAARLRLAKIGVSEPRFADPVGALRSRGLLGPDEEPGRLGIPQGSALSCVLANIVLSSADTLVNAQLRARGRREDGLYLRYCDDIVIIHRDRDLCQLALDVYCRALAGLSLPVHPPKVVAEYPGSRRLPAEEPGGFFWGGKSKAPYRWGANLSCRSDVPWLAFVGYQVARDGTVRVRRSSIDKELKKQRRVATDIINELRKEARKAKFEGRIHLIQDLRAVRYRATMHLLSIGVGYPSEWTTSPAPGAVSWCKGFRGMASARVVAAPLQILDRGRISVLRYLEARVRSMLRMRQLGTIEREEEEEQPVDDHPKRREFRLDFAGAPLSYRNQFKGQG